MSTPVLRRVRAWGARRYLALLCCLTLSLLVAPHALAAVIYDFPLDTDPGWTADAGWEWGSGADGAATAARSGTDWYSFTKDSVSDPTGSYPEGMSPSYLTTEQLNFAGVLNVHLRFWRLLGLANSISPGDRAAVEISTDGVNWSAVWETTATVDDTDWVACDYDISSIADNQPAVWVRWVMGPTNNDGDVSFGWNLDDVWFSGDGTPASGATFPLDSSPGWGITGGWAFGLPLGNAGDPTAGYTGSNVYGYNLSGAYPNSLVAEYLTSPAFDCSSAEDVYLTFWRWLTVEASDSAFLSASVNGTDWYPFWVNTSAIADTSWQYCSYDISAFAAGQATVYVRWQMGPTDGSGQAGGWNVDDISVIGWTNEVFYSADFMSDVTSGPAPLAVTFTDISTLDAVDWYWEFGDGHHSYLQNPTHEYAEPGLYTVTLTVTDGYGESADETKTDYIAVVQAPEADFTADNWYGEPPLVVQFTDGSYFSPTEWAWDFGDGTTSTEQNPSHTYTAVGEYTVTLVATNEQGASSVSYTIVVGEPSTALFTANPTTVVVGQSVQFIDQSSGTPFYWQWDFGDGGTSDQQNPSHSYTAAGSYTVSLEVTGAGPSSLLSRDDYIVVMEAPSANFEATPTAAAVTDPIVFTDLSTGSPDSWSWVFGDGNTSTEQNPTHSYTDPGFYTVALTVELLGVPSTETKTRYLAIGFADAGPDFWAFRNILACYDAGIVLGYWDGYHPSEPVSRAQMAVYIARAVAGGDTNVPTGPATAAFADVPTDYWAFKYVEYLADPTRNVVKGYWDGYHPEDVVTRDQMAVYVARSIVTPLGDDGLVSYTPPTTATFVDVPTDFWAYKHIEYLAGLSIVQGYWDGYRPSATVTRDQMAVYVQRAFGLPTT